MEDKLIKFLRKEKAIIGNELTLNLQKEEKEAITKWLNLINYFEQEIDLIPLNKTKTFDLTVLPSIVQDLVQVALTKTPSFANITATSIVTFCLSELFGQLRPRIVDSIYSPDSLGLPYYSIVLSGSGSGKDSTYNAMKTAMRSAYEYIEKLKTDEIEDIAKKIFIAQMKREDPDFDITTVRQEHYQHLVKPPEETTISLRSTRGGITSSLNRLDRYQWGTKSMFSSEFAMAMQGSGTVTEVFELFSEMFDNGSAASPEFKTEENKEKPITDKFINMLGISSPTMFYTDEAVKNKLIPLISTALARRMFFVSPEVKEDYENLVIPDSTEGVRELLANNRLKHRQLIESTNEELLRAVETVKDSKTLVFEDSAAQLYEDYKAYTQYKATVISTILPNSILALEMQGRAFKLGRVAGLWALAQNTCRIDVPTLQAAIYFAEHSAEHLSRFAKQISMKPYDLLANDYISGVVNGILPVDKAITLGYITSATQSTIKAFLEPLNSSLKGIAVVNYSDKDNAFKFIATEKNESVGDYSYSANKVSTPSDRENVTSYTYVKDNAKLSTIINLITTDSTYNPFGTKDSTKFVVLDIKSSNISIEILHKYLKYTNHLISLKDDTEDNFTYTLFLPLSETITKHEYMYVCNSIATNLMLRPVKGSTDPSTVYQGYKGTKTINNINNELSLYDISDIRAKMASKKPYTTLRDKDINLTTTQKRKRAEKAMDEYESMIIALENADNMLLEFAHIARYLKTEFVEEQDLIDRIDNLNSSLPNPIDEVKKQKYLIEPFKDL